VKYTFSALLTFLSGVSSRALFPVFLAVILCCGRAAGQYTCTMSLSSTSISPSSWTTGTITLSPPIAQNAYVPVNVFWSETDPLNQDVFTQSPTGHWQLYTGESVMTFSIAADPLSTGMSATLAPGYWYDTFSNEVRDEPCGPSVGVTVLPAHLVLSLDTVGESGGTINGYLSFNPGLVQQVVIQFQSSNTALIDPSKLSSPNLFPSPPVGAVTVPSGATVDVSFPVGQATSTTTQLVTISAGTSTYTGELQASATVSIEPQLIPEVNLGPCIDCEAKAGAPINVTTGNVWITQNDYSLPGLGGGIQMVRTWNSMLQSSNPPQLAGIFGSGWRASYEESLQTIDGNHKTYRRGDGSGWDFAYNGSAYSLTAPTDTNASLAFNSSTMIFTLTFADGTKKLFDNSGRLTTVIDRNNNQTTLTYDGSGRLAQITDPANRSLTFSYGDPQNINRVTSMQDGTGTVATFTYDAPSRLTSVAYPDGSGASFVYDANSFITSVLDPQGKVIESHTYDSTGRGLTSANANGTSQVAMTYGSNTGVLTDSLGDVTTYQRNRISGKNYIASVAGTGCSTCGGRGNWSYSYDGQGHRTQAVDPLGHFTSYSYDSNGNILQKQIQRDSANDTQNWGYTYNSLNEVLTATDPLGKVTTNTYDSKGNLLTTTTPSPGGHTSGSKTTFTYDTKGELTKITDPLSHDHDSLQHDWAYIVNHRRSE
jgi:YD repeat-containing protein